MFDHPTLTIFGFTFRTYTFLLSLVISGAIGGLMIRTPRRGSLVDVCLGGLVGGLLVGRIFHVALNWAYFAYHTWEITALHLGGYDWHGALIGALVSMGIVARWRRVAILPVLDKLALALPLLMLAAWWGCRTALCAWGAEVNSMADYPAGMTWEAMDGFGLLAPRFQTQTLGMMVAVLLIIVALLLLRLRWFEGRRFGLILLLICLADGGLTLLRGDYAPVIAGLRAEIWLDMWLGGAAVLLLLLTVRQSGSPLSNV